MLRPEPEVPCPSEQMDRVLGLHSEHSPRARGSRLGRARRGLSCAEAHRGAGRVGKGRGETENPVGSLGTAGAPNSIATCGSQLCPQELSRHRLARSLPGTGRTLVLLPTASAQRPSLASPELTFQAHPPVEKLARKTRREDDLM